MVSKNCGSAATGGSAARKKTLCFKNRKACILKKMMEFSVLCDVDACAIVVSPDEEVETWPENHSAVLKPIKRYKDWLRNNKKMVSSVECDHEKNALPENDHEWALDDALIDGLSLDDLLKDSLDVDDRSKDCVAVEDFLKDSVDVGDPYEKQGLNFHPWEDCLLDALPVESVKELLTAVDPKLQAVTERIDLYQQRNTKGKRLVALDEETQQNIQTTNYSWFDNGSNIWCASSSQLEASEEIIQSLNCSWFDNGSNLWFNNGAIFSHSEALEDSIQSLSCSWFDNGSNLCCYNNSACSSWSETLEEVIQSTNCSWSDNPLTPWFDNGACFSDIGASEESIQTPKFSSFENGLNFWFNNDLSSSGVEALESSQTPVSFEETPEQSMSEMVVPEGFVDLWDGLLA